MKKIKILNELLKYSYKKYKKLMLIIIFESIFSAFLPLINIVGIGYIIDAITSSKDKTYVSRFILIFVLLNMTISMIKTVLIYYHNKVTRQVSDDIQIEYIKDALQVDYHWAQDGSVLDMKMKSMGANPVFVFTYIGQFVDYIIKISGIILIILKLSTFFILILITLSTLMILLTFKLRKIEFEYNNSQVENKRIFDYLYRLMTKYSFGKEVRISNLKYLILSKNKKIVKLILNKLKTFLRKKIKINSLLIIISILQSIAMYTYFSYQIFNKLISLPEYIVLLGAVTLLTSILVNFFDNIARIDRMTAGMDIFIHYKNWIKNNSSTYLTNTNNKMKIDTDKFELQFKNVSFKYPNTEKMVLNNLNFSISKNEKIGLVGLNASGKTTIVKLLLRLYIPTEGKILINDIDINLMPIDMYLRLVSAVLQDFVVFAYSIKENIVFDNEATSSNLIRIIKECGLYSKVMKMSNNLDTILYKELDENGIELSGGEGQKLALARALFRNGSLLILDEPTSNLDPNAEHEMYSRLNDFSENKSTIFITHRLSSTKFCDRIIVIENGSIIEEGTHFDLMDRKGLYYTLFNTQAKYYMKGLSYE